MKPLHQFIIERLKPGTKLIVFDIDDTILKVNKDLMRIYKRVPGSQKEIALTTDEFAKDPDAGDPTKKSWFDYRDFEDPTKVYSSIITGTPLMYNIRLLDDYLKRGYDFCFLTARGCEDVVKSALEKFFSARPTSQLRELGETFKHTLSHAVNDHVKQYKGSTDAEKKANILKELCQQYDAVVFVDDDQKNLENARQLNLPNLRVIKAWNK